MFLNLREQQHGKRNEIAKYSGYWLGGFRYHYPEIFPKISNSFKTSVSGMLAHSLGNKMALK